MKHSASVPALGSGQRTAARSAAEMLLNGSFRPPSAGRDYSFDVAKTPRRSRSLTALQGVQRMELRHGAPHGLEWKGTIVSKVDGQAKQLGVKPGWKIQQIDNAEVNSADEVWAKLQEAKWEWRSCYVGFVTNIKAIRNEQQLIRKEEMRAEEQRLAKLPFANSFDEMHLSQIKEEFQFQGYIENIEDRAISLQQFKNALQWAAGRCHRWRDAASAEKSKTSGMKLHIEIMTMYHLYHWLIRPSTVAKITPPAHTDCSFIEMLTHKPQQPSWFIIHWWGDRLLDMVKCMELHIQTRKTKVPNFWISACAVRPHSQTPEIDRDPQATCFYKALVASNFQVLFLLDRRSEYNTGPATPFTRTWCGYEAMTCLDNEETTMDIATCHPKPMILTMGLTEEELDMERLEPGDGYKAKSEREKGFSLDVVELGLSYRIENTTANDWVDRQKILNCIANRELMEPVAVKSPFYEKANARLGVLFGLVFWRRAMSGASSDTDMQRIQTLLVDALRADQWRESLELDLSFIGGGDERVQLLMKNLPPNLKSLKLNLQKTDVTNDAIAALSANLPRTLEELNVDLSQNPDVDNFGVTDFVNRLPGQVSDVHMNLNSTSVGKAFMGAQNSLTGLQQQIMAEAEKGDLCITFNLCPSVNRRMTQRTSKCKINVDVPKQ